MAIYEFDCAACGERFEVSRPMSEHDRLKEQPTILPDVWGTRRSRAGPAGEHQSPERVVTLQAGRFSARLQALSLQEDI